jgi:anti-anti-sigma factor
MPSPPPGHAERLRALLASEQRAASPSGFRCDVRREGDTVTLVPSGELDVATAPLLAAQLRAAAGLGARTTVLDLRGLGFIDSAGVATIVRAADSAARHGRAFRVVPGPERVELAAHLRRLLGQRHDAA